MIAPLLAVPEQRPSRRHPSTVELGELREHARPEPILAAHPDHPDNVDQLGRAFTVDLNKFVPGIKKGQQTYPIVVNGTMYITSGDDQVFAVNAATGDLLWHYARQRRHLQELRDRRESRVAYCDNRVFLLTLDMTIVALDPATGQQLARVPIGKPSPARYANYGYSETSAPICANHRLIVGAAGSEYGARGFVMAYNTPTSPPPGRTRSGHPAERHRVA